MRRKELEMSDAITITRSTARRRGRMEGWRFWTTGVRPSAPLCSPMSTASCARRSGSWTARRSDPFHPTAELVEILRFQARQEVAA